ncbi:molybdenum cofactor cytidylyltransferase [Zhaonella formicivorans]|uniref:molybdenum cofactor cytidylyltransferase n=1 Tax=Zhaonella formicivorans TaxID=2528593 RepID=UPI0010DF1CA5|nr:molybdenum cofactor cytidylyltransferase [Zhaonella formicivorans]
MKIAVVILAAGKASRMGRTKQLLPWGESTLLGSTIDLYTGAKVDEVIVVVGHCAAEIRAALKDKAVRWVENKAYEQGMSTSLKAGIEALNDGVSAVLLALGDLPLLKKETIRCMLKIYKNNNCKIVIPYYHNKRGNPVLISRELFPELLAIQGDQGAREVIKKYESQVYKLPVDDPGILQDVDTWEDYKRLLAQSHQP